MNKQRTAPIEMKAEDFRAIGHHLVDRIADFLDSLPAHPLRLENHHLRFVKRWTHLASCPTSELIPLN